MQHNPSTFTVKDPDPSYTTVAAQMLAALIIAHPNCSVESELVERALRLTDMLLEEIKYPTR